MTLEQDTPAGTLAYRAPGSDNQENAANPSSVSLEPGHRRVRNLLKSPAMPALPLHVAMLCCCLNFVIPGFGTFIAGLGQCCCADPERKFTPCVVFASCVLVAIAQLVTTPIVCIGWIWSCLWGVGFVVTSVHAHSVVVSEDETGERGRRRGFTIVIPRGPQAQRRGRLTQPQGPPSYDDVVKSDADRRSQLGVIMEQPEETLAASSTPTEAPPPYSP